MIIGAESQYILPNDRTKKQTRRGVRDGGGGEGGGEA